ncbi:uncharacterized protein EKO05_0005913 [Ascochyta rabiei]|uniref:Uncharacterized protein n=1 Tax=Didymella rabiei TaxID=5454 RepID=A0A163JKG7_DIDRA|nr:uncharacterized protein EKO05_0005913 [Ascochyta rabiei]KZM26418.1 hypothetical protein ST47_g2429 [Ascochyta rabiei]UPX15467.1 hypothetical protein EKO05_0005913 [Ascochyta rabiei]
MRTCAIAVLAGLSSLVSSQTLDLDYIEAQTLSTATINLYQQAQTVEYNQATAIADVVAAVLETPVADPGKERFNTGDVLQKRDEPAVTFQVLVPICQTLHGTLYDSPEDTVTDRVGKFLNDAALQDQAVNAITPAGYTQVFRNLKNASQANGYMGYRMLSTYNVSECANICTSTLGCQAFNIYLERGPSQVPGTDCLDPPALVNPFCALWGGPVSTDNALNEGQYREQFHVVITASNGYVASSSLNRLSSFAILAPLDCNGNDSYMGMRLWSDGPFDRQRCAAICDATTQYNVDHHPVDSKIPPRLCKFYNTFIVSKNFISQGQYCAMYSQFWDPELYANNSGQYDGDGNRYTISSSEFFHNNTEVTSPICPADLAGLRDDYIASVFCTSYISYAGPATVSTTITNTATSEVCSTAAVTTTTKGTSITPTPEVSSTTSFQPIVSISSDLRKRENDAGEVVGAVVAVFPDKIADPAITGSVPVEVTISAKDLSIAGAYSSATSEAISQLAVRETGSLTSSTDGSAPTTTPPAVSIPVLDKRQTALTPAFFQGRDYRDISSACSQIVDTVTQTTTYSATPDATVRPIVDCSSASVCDDDSPPTLISGSFFNSSYKVDDIYYNISLPFEICIYDNCSSNVHPTSNGIITLGDFATGQYNNDRNDIPATDFPSETALFVYWDDLYIFPSQSHYMAYSICGQEGSRKVVFSWKLGRYQTVGPVFDGRVWSFSATFFENENSHIVLDYGTIPDRGISASVGLQSASGAFFEYSHLETKIRNGLRLSFDARHERFGIDTIRR